MQHERKISKKAKIIRNRLRSAKTHKEFLQSIYPHWDNQGEAPISPAIQRETDQIGIAWMESNDIQAQLKMVLEENSTYPEISSGWQTTASLAKSKIGASDNFIKYGVGLTNTPQLEASPWTNKGKNFPSKKTDSQAYKALSEQNYPARLPRAIHFTHLEQKWCLSANRTNTGYDLLSITTGMQWLYPTLPETFDKNTIELIHTLDVRYQLECANGA